MQVTPEKLEEMKEKMPKAGPKYRLGMYFETIHGLTEFEESACPPEDGYSSCWETDTEIDSEFGNLIFSKVTGDSASMICIDEAMDLLALREQRQQLMDRGVEIQPEQLHQISELPLERSDDSKRSATSRHSHHSGSDGTYEGPPPQDSPTHSARPSSAQDHIYETLDDYQVDFPGHMEGFYGSKASDGSRGSSGSTTKQDTRHSDDGFMPSTRCPPKSSLYRGLTKHRSFSAPQHPEGLQLRHRRKLSEVEYPKKRKQHCSGERSDSVAPLKPFPLPAKAYGTFPRGLPSEYTEYMAIPGLPTKKSPCHQEDGKKPRRGPSLIIKHKGKTYLIPVVDKKVKERWEKSRPSATEEQPSGFRATPVPGVAFSTLPKHTTLNTNVSRSNSSANSVYQTVIPVQSRRHASPPEPRLVLESSEQATATPVHKKKCRPSSQSTTPTTPKQVTHYGVV